jgi:hypothetical protein
VSHTLWVGLGLPIESAEPPNSGVALIRLGWLLPPMPDDRLAMIVKFLDQSADREFVAFNGWKSNDWQDPEVRSFLDRFPDPVS